MVNGQAIYVPVIVRQHLRTYVMRVVFMATSSRLRKSCGRPQLFRRRAGDPQPIDSQSLQQRGESAPWLRPWYFHNSRSVFGALGSGRRRMQDRLILTGVQVPPLPLLLMVIKNA